MESGEIVLLECASAGCSATTLEIALRSAFTEHFAVRSKSVKDHNSREEISDLWKTASGVAPNLAFLLGNSDSTDRMLQVLRAARMCSASPIIIAMDRVEPELVWDFLELGANDFLIQPWRSAEILPRVWRLLGRSSSHPEPSRRAAPHDRFSEFIGRNEKLRVELERIPLAAELDVGMLIEGESGTGKEMVAQAVHRLSLRAGKPFVAVNSGAIPVDLIESELFGHERGAFTGAAATQSGLIEQAEGGTLFLDEIGCLPLQAQVKLLRFLQSHEYRPLGAGKARTANVRIIAATNANLEQAVSEGKFRADLYYRLDVVSIFLPPLRERREDIPLLANHFLQKYAFMFSKSLPGFEPSAMLKLFHHGWPGNVRELENVVQRAAVFAKEMRLIGADITVGRSLPPIPESLRQKKARMIAEFEKTHVEELLASHQGNISHAAISAGKNRRAFWQLLRKHKIDAGRFKLS